MNLEQFQEMYHLRPAKADSSGDRIIIGKLFKDCGKDVPENHCHIFEHNGRFAAYFNMPTRARWNSIQRQVMPLGAHLGPPCGECDGFINFNPEDETLVRLILRLARVGVKRQLSTEQREKLKARFAKAKV